MISDKTDDIMTTRQSNQAIKKLHQYWRTDRARWMSAQTNWMNIKCAISIVIISDVSQRIKRTHISSITIYLDGYSALVASSRRGGCFVACSAATRFSGVALPPSASVRR